MGNIKKGQTVYFFDAYDNFQTGIVAKTFDANIDGDKVPFLCINGGITQTEENCYLSKEACLKAKKEKDTQEVNRIIGSIDSVEDLIRFMYNTTVSPAAEYTDWNARKAVKILAKALLNIDLD